VEAQGSRVFVPLDLLFLCREGRRGGDVGDVVSKSDFGQTEIRRWKREAMNTLDNNGPKVSPDVNLRSRASAAKELHDRD
jgi:hypothetical protein